ncbi:DUF2057 domain-containing protein [Amphritea sp. 1_MG-2023]|uniref:YccT family protein n=1 Tax=Amphritea sp. 1_MG-2023 TaxID=3062670 RepID=UPI0026E26746|nr:DUF2057 domain-containing protein [Amphritea sp. 1_MG-2023]MDO6565084.1 DUF2057 domain-containing protein [Amphritea sp. 1_MG-2023]
MRFCSIIFSSFVLLFSSSLMADNNFSTAADISLIAINGVEIESDSFFDNKQMFTLPNGKNQILVQFSTEVNTSGGLAFETTDAHVLVFNAVDKDIQLSAPDIKKLSEFRQFNLGNAWILKDSDGAAIEYLSEALIKDGFQMNRNYEQELKKLNAAGHAVSITELIKYTGFASDSAMVKSSDYPDNKLRTDSINLPETLLRYWYLNADLDTRAKFKAWINAK